MKADLRYHPIVRPVVTELIFRRIVKDLHVIRTSQLAVLGDNDMSGF